MRVQIIYGEHTEADFVCKGCRGTGRVFSVDRGAKCWACLGRGDLVADQRAYTYEAPEDTKLWDVLVTPTPQQSGRRGTVIRLSSDYTGPCKDAYRAGREDEARHQEDIMAPDPWHEESTVWADPWPER